VVADDTNGRITLAVLATKLDYVIRQVDHIVLCGTVRDERINTLEDSVRGIQQINKVLITVLVGIAIGMGVAWLKNHFGL